MIWTTPLNWPPGWPTASRISGSFKVTLGEAEKALSAELERLGASSAYLSTDNPITVSGRPKNDFGQGHPAVVLHFSRAGKELTIPCDKFDDLRGNLRAIGLSLEAIRRMERYGTSQIVDAALSGFAQLPAGASAPKPKRPWWEVLQVNQGTPKAIVEAAYTIALKSAHPDAGGTTEAFQEVREAYKEAMEVLK